MKGYEILKANHCTKWSSDDRNDGAIEKEDQAQVNGEWIPLAVKAGWKYWALLLPEQAIAQMNIKRMAEDCKKVGVQVRLFSDAGPALDWISSQR